MISRRDDSRIRARWAVTVDNVGPVRGSPLATIESARSHTRVTFPPHCTAYAFLLPHRFLSLAEAAMRLDSIDQRVTCGAYPSGAEGRHGDLLTHQPAIGPAPTFLPAVTALLRCAMSAEKEKRVSLALDGDRSAGVHRNRQRTRNGIDKPASSPCHKRWHVITLDMRPGSPQQKSPFWAFAFWVTCGRRSFLDFQKPSRYRLHGRRFIIAASAGGPYRRGCPGRWLLKADGSRRQGWISRVSTITPTEMAASPSRSRTPPSLFLEATAPRAIFFDFTVRPIVPTDKSPAIFEKVIAWRDSVR